ncbi:MAG: helix-turn-helix transcriptional regulator [Thermoanaerobaculales bacterium]|nr:helix-turn-helix transcriptional regulator [Thermoanaerobaculales bacterium]
MTDLELETQNLARSCHEALILAILGEGPRHGYQLALEIEDRSDGRFRFNHGTLYPILHKLESGGFIDGSWAEPAGKRKRRQYALTSAGRKQLDWLRDAWSSYFNSLFKVIGRSEP